MHFSQELVDVNASECEETRTFGTVGNADEPRNTANAARATLNANGCRKALDVTRQRRRVRAPSQAV